MALSPELSAALADKPTLLEEAKGLDVKAEKLTPDVEAELPKLGEYKSAAAALAKVLADTKAKDAEALIKDFGAIKSVNLDLKGQVEKLKTGAPAAGTVDIKDHPDFKAVLEQVETIKRESTERIAALENESKTNKDAAARADAEKRDTDLRASVIAAAAKFKIKNAEDEFLLLKAKGQIGYTEKDGKHAPFFHKLNEKGEKVTVSSAEELIQHIANTDKSKVDASGKGGAGAQHGGAGGPGVDVPKTAAEARSGFLRKS